LNHCKKIITERLIGVDFVLKMVLIFKYDSSLHQNQDVFSIFKALV